MDEKTLGLTIAVLAAGVPCVLLGYLIAKKRMYALISGWDPDKYTDPDAVGQANGYVCIVLGILITLISVLWWSGLIAGPVFAVALTVTSILPVFVIMFVSHKYAKT